MTKVTIVNIDLGESIDDIITDDINALTEKNQKDIEQAIDTAKKVKEAKEQKVNKSKMQEQKLDIVLSEVYEKMLGNHKHDLTTPLEEMLEITKPHISSPTSLMMRLKTYIKKKHDNQYVLKKCQRQGKTHYQLLEYNVD